MERPLQKFSLILIVLAAFFFGIAFDRERNSNAPFGIGFALMAIGLGFQQLDARKQKTGLR